MNLTIRAQLIGGFAIVVALLITVFGVSFWGMNSMANATDEIVHVDVPAEMAVKEVEKLVLEQTIFYADYAITRDPDALAEIEHEIEVIESKIVELHDLFGNQAESDALINVFHEEYNNFIHEGELFVAAVDAAAAGGSASDSHTEPALHGAPEEPGNADDATHSEGESEVVVLLHALEAEEQIMLGELEEIAHLAETKLEHAADSAAAAERNAIIFASVLALIAALISAAVAYLLIKKITSGLSAVEDVATALSGHTLPTLVDNMKRAAAGDLTTSFSLQLANIEEGQDDEIGKIKRAFNRIQEAVRTTGDSYNLMMKEISGLVAKVRQMSLDLNSASSQLAASSSQAGDATSGLADASQQVASGAQEQATNIQTASSLVDDLVKNVGLIRDGSQKQNAEIDRAQGVVSQVADASRQVAENAQGATDGAQTANKAAENGVQVVEKTIDGMKSISDAVKNVAAEVSNLGERSQEIGNIIRVSQTQTTA